MMNHINVPLEGIEETVVRPVVTSVAKELRFILGISKNAKVFVDTDFTDENNKVENNVDKTYAAANEFISITSSEEEFGYSSLLAHRYIKENSDAFFYDTDIGLQVSPMYLDSKITLSVSFNSKSKNNILKMKKKLLEKVIRNRDATIHSIEYNAIIPNSIIKLFRKVNELKNNKDSLTNLTESEYIEKFGLNRLTFASNAVGDGNRVSLLFKEKQTSIIGYYSSSVANLKHEYDEASRTYFINIDYTFTYNKLISFNLVYPDIVYNQELPKEFVVGKNIIENKDVGNYQGLNKPNPFLIPRCMNSNYYYINIPRYDNYILPKPPRFLSRVFSVLILVEEEDKKRLFNLKELPGVELLKPILDSIRKTEYKYVNKMLKSIFHIELYDSNKLLPEEYITVDKNLNVISTVDLNYKKIYRVAFNIVNDLDKLDKKVLERTNITIDNLNKDMSVLQTTINNHTDSHLYGDLKLVKTTVPYSSYKTNPSKKLIKFKEEWRNNTGEVKVISMSMRQLEK